MQFDELFMLNYKPGQINQIMGNKLSRKRQELTNKRQSNCQEILSQNHQTKSIFKLILFGDRKAGKTCICKQLALGSFNRKQKPTITGDFFDAKREYNQKRYSINLWDTSSDHQTFGSQFFDSADTMLIVFDVTNKHNLFKVINFWMKKVSKLCTKQPPIFLIGNKSDRTYQKKVSKAKGESEAQKYGFKYMQVSAKTGKNLQEMLLQILYNLNQQL